MSHRSALISLILSLTLISVLVFWQPWQSPRRIKAFGPLIVQFSQSPLFQVSGWLPGDSDQQWFTVENQDNQPRQLAVRADNLVESVPSGFDQQIEISFLHNSQLVYQTSLANFFNQPFVLLGNLSPGESKTWQTEVVFSPLSGNLYQLGQVTFDLIFMEQIVGPDGQSIPPECQSVEFQGTPIVGTNGRDLLRGTTGNDLIWGLDGNDQIFGSGGDDCIVAGAGDDRIYGGTGKDYIWGDAGEDYINAGSDEDNVWGGEGNDYLRAGSDSDLVWGEAGDDRIDGGSGNDVLSGGEGNDQIKGGSGNDQLIGNEGDDRLEGGSANDQLIGGSGIDFANGQTGTDQCVAETQIRCEL